MRCPQVARRWVGCLRVAHDQGLGLDENVRLLVCTRSMMLTGINAKVYAINRKDGKPDGEDVILRRMSRSCGKRCVEKDD